MEGEPPPVAALEQLMSEKGERLLRTAILLTGSRADGEDLLQSALVRVMDSWRKIDDLENYLRRALTNLAIDGWRRRTGWRARLGLIATPESVPDESSAVDNRDRIVRLLHQLPPRQRTAIVLRYWEDLTEAETAKAMGCSVGTVKATTFRAMQRLRELSDSESDPAPVPDPAGSISLSTLATGPAGSPA